MKLVPASRSIRKFGMLNWSAYLGSIWSNNTMSTLVGGSPPVSAVAEVLVTATRLAASAEETARATKYKRRGRIMAVPLGGVGRSLSLGWAGPQGVSQIAK